MKVYELLDSPEKWTNSGAFAETASGHPVPALHAFAVRWCLMGACIRCYPKIELLRPVAQQIIKRVGRWSVWNDAPERTYEEVVALARELDI